LIVHQELMRTVLLGEYQPTRPAGQEESFHRDKQISFPIMKMKMYAILDKVNPHTENIKGFNWAAVNYTTV
jgi:hypothetical protein